MSNLDIQDGKTLGTSNEVNLLLNDALFEQVEEGVATTEIDNNGIEMFDRPQTKKMFSQIVRDRLTGRDLDIFVLYYHEGLDPEFVKEILDSIVISFGDFSEEWKNKILLGQEKMTQESIGKLFDVKGARIGQLLERARRKLRSGEYGDRIKNLLGE